MPPKDLPPAACGHPSCDWYNKPYSRIDSVERHHNVKHTSCSFNKDTCVKVLGGDTAHNAVEAPGGETAETLEAEIYGRSIPPGLILDPDLPGTDSMKRRAATTPSPVMATSDTAKRQKRNNGTNFPDVPETAETTSETGLKLMRQLRNSRDKSGRVVANHFLTLPDKAGNPFYYQQIKMPLAMDTIEDRLDRRQYPNLSSLESDLKRLVQNAKDFNSTKSEIYEDAERIRKALSNFMPRHNPAYQSSNYRAMATPIPLELTDGQPTASHLSPADLNGHAHGDMQASNFRDMNNRRKGGTATLAEDEEASALEVLSKPQMGILEKMMELPNSDNFHVKPSKREYPDYYRLIEHPIGLKDILKKAEKGELSTWEDFVDEVRLIWQNAKQYNEEGSLIVRYAEEIEKWFEDHMRGMGIFTAKKISLKLSMPSIPQPAPRLSLKFNKHGSAPTPPIEVDSESLRRQNEDINKAKNASRGISKIPFSGDKILASQSSDANLMVKRGMSAAQPMTQIKAVNGETMGKEDASEITVKPSKVVTPVETKSMVAPTISNATSQPPLATLSQMVDAGNVPQPQQVVPAPAQASYSIHDSDSPIDRTYRDEGRGMEFALFDRVTIMTSPRLPDDPRWRRELYPPVNMTQSSHYQYLDHRHYIVRVIPHLSESCLRRPRFKVCVCLNWVMMQPQQDEPGVWEFSLFPGDNNIIVDIIADLLPGERKPYAPPQLQLDFERKQFTAWLMDPPQYY